MRSGFFYDFSKKGTYERLTDDGLTQWHPAFLQLGKSLEECAQRYRGFCQKYKGKKKPAGKKSHWGNKLLAGFSFFLSQYSTKYQISKKAVELAIVEQFILANQAFCRNTEAIALEMKPEMRSHFLLDCFSGVRSLAWFCTRCDRCGHLVVEFPESAIALLHKS